ncbi:MAG: reductive dehalogenase [Bacteroidota bacterium]
MKTKIIEENSKDYLNKRFNIQPQFKRFRQRFDIFNRAIWDEKVNPKNFFISYDITNYAPKKAKGFDHWDYAFRNASWHLTDVVGERKFDTEGRVEGFTDYYTTQTQPPASQAPIISVEESTKRIKQASLMFGAGAVGICELDERWVYEDNFRRKTEASPEMDLPKSYTHAILLIIPMDYRLSKTYPAALSGAATGLGYSIGLNAANSLAQFITNLGFGATASLNDTALNIPMAIEAGLGEYGRHGLLITPKFGPNIRIAKVFTDLPLIADKPIEFGVKEFCEICNKCASSCPVKAIPHGEPQDKAPNISSLEGIRKWTVNAEKCFKFWVGMNTDCAICIRVCPYNKDFSKWWNRLGIKLANSPLRKFMLWLDDKLGFGKRQLPEAWWE